jgi:hypothetical protein
VFRRGLVLTTRPWPTRVLAYLLNYQVGVLYWPALSELATVRLSLVFLFVENFLFREKISSSSHEGLPSNIQLEAVSRSPRTRARAFCAKRRYPRRARDVHLYSFFLPRRVRPTGRSSEACCGATGSAWRTHQNAASLDASHSAATLASRRRLHAGHDPASFASG